MKLQCFSVYLYENNFNFSPMNILITGANGQLGLAIRDVVNKIGNGHPDHTSDEKNYYIFTSSHKSSENDIILDITKENDVKNFIEKNKINIVINCAAYTNVDRAENIDKELAYKINANGVSYLAQACKNMGALLIHISTDYVFNGSNNEFYTPNYIDNGSIIDRNKPEPINEYGKSKLLGEQLIKESGCYYMIFRTSCLYSPYGKKNFFLSIMNKLKDNSIAGIPVADYIYACPTYAYDLANFLIRIIEENNSENRYLSQVGTYHYCNKGIVSRYRLALEIESLRNEYLPANHTYKIAPYSIDCTITNENAKRPKCTGLSTESLNCFNEYPAPWQESLEKCMEKYIKENE